MTKSAALGGAVVGLAIAGIISAIALSGGGDAPSAAAPSAGPTPASTGLAAAKQQIQQQALHAAESLAQQHPHTKPPASIGGPAGLPNEATVAPRATPTAGIYPDRQPFFPPAAFASTNFFQGPVHGQWLLVWAGSTTARSGLPTGAGAVRIYAGNVASDSVPSYVGEYTAPSGLGTLRIKGYSGSTLTLTDPAGTLVTFDLATRTYR